MSEINAGDNHKDIKPNKQIFKIECTPENAFTFEINTNHIPTLCYCLEILRVEVDKMIIDNKLKQFEKDGNLITKPEYLGGLRGFLNRGHRR